MREIYCSAGKEDRLRPPDFQEFAERKTVRQAPALSQLRAPGPRSGCLAIDGLHSEVRLLS